MYAILQRLSNNYFLENIHEIEAMTTVPTTLFILVLILWKYASKDKNSDPTYKNVDQKLQTIRCSRLHSINTTRKLVSRNPGPPSHSN